MKFSVVILAAGVGSRMKSPKPKVLHTICGRSMIAGITEAALQVSDDVHIILHHQKDLIEAHINDYCATHLPKDARTHITLHTQNVAHFPGTGGALMDPSGQLIALKYDRLVVLNGDMPLIRPESIAAIAQSPAPIVVSTITLENPSGYGRVVLDSGQSRRIVRIVEQKDCTPEECKITLVNAGIYGFDRAILARSLPKLSNNNAQQEYYLTDVIALNAGGLDSGDLADSTDSARAPNLPESTNTLESSRIEIAPFYGEAQEFMGVNSKAELALAESLRLCALRQKALDQGVIMRMPESIYLDEWVEFEGECELESHVQIRGRSVIRHSLIRAGSVIEESVIERSDIGPMAHIRPKSVICDTHIGNFVETKAAHLQGVKAGHLSYLGDCVIERGSNVGAGVITCNYDGKAKHKTHVGENVFIGSDSQLIAPCSIESNSMIAAGSTITDPVRSGDLAISRGKQRNIAGFFGRFFGK